MNYNFIQEFTAPQIVDTLHVNTMLLSGNFNGRDIKNLYDNSVWLNESITVKRPVFST